MGFRDTLEVSSEIYTSQLIHKKYSYRQLRKKHHQKIMLSHMHSLGAGAGIGAAPFTLGITLITAGYNSRQVFVVVQQQRCIEALMIKKELPVPRERKRDIAAGVAIGLLTVGLGVLLPGCVEGLAGHAASAVASQVQVNPAMAADAIMNNSGNVLDGIKEGVTATVETQVDSITHQVSDVALVPILSDQGGQLIAEATGQGLGVMGTTAVEVIAVKMGVAYVSEEVYFAAHANAEEKEKGEEKKD